MLYDPKWEKPVTKGPSFAGLVAWLETQPRDDLYDWFEIDRCVVGRYLAAQHPAAVLIYSGLFKNVGEYYRVCQAKPHTFGAALKRARALS